MATEFVALVNVHVHTDMQICVGHSLLLSAIFHYFMKIQSFKYVLVTSCSLYLSLSSSLFSFKSFPRPVGRCVNSFMIAENKNNVCVLLCAASGFKTTWRHHKLQAFDTFPLITEDSYTPMCNWNILWHKMTLATTGTHTHVPIKVWTAYWQQGAIRSHTDIYLWMDCYYCSAIELRGATIPLRVLKPIRAAASCSLFQPLAL